MPTKLEIALEQVSGDNFEKLVPGILKERGYEIKTSGIKGTDGGWDAFVDLEDRSGVAHASVRRDWRQKLRDDAESSEGLEDEQGLDFDLFVFVTAREPTGQQELDFREEIRKEYGWELVLLHRRDLILTLENDQPELAERYLNVDLGAFQEKTEVERSIRWHRQVKAQVNQIQRLAKKRETGAIISEGKIQRRLEPKVDTLSQLANEGGLSGSTGEITEQVEQVVEIGDEALQVNVDFNTKSIQSQLRSLNEIADELMENIDAEIDRMSNDE